MNRWEILIPVALVLASCNNQSAAPTTSAAPPSPSTITTASGVIGTPAPGSKFSRIHLGMSKTEIQDIIGPPTDENNHITGKSFIPFYFGGDTSRLEAHYRGEGVLTYSPRSFASSSYELIGMVVNPQEPGYVR